MLKRRSFSFFDAAGLFLLLLLLLLLLPLLLRSLTHTHTHTPTHTRTLIAWREGGREGRREGDGREKSCSIIASNEALTRIDGRFITAVNIVIIHLICLTEP